MVFLSGKSFVVNIQSANRSACSWGQFKGSPTGLVDCTDAAFTLMYKRFKNSPGVSKSLRKSLDGSGLFSAVGLSPCPFLIIRWGENGER
jgi:hypothetical protein